MSQIQVIIYVAFKIGDTVYRKIDPEQKGIVIGYDVRPEFIHYYVSWKDGEYSFNYEIELTTEPSFNHE